MTTPPNPVLLLYQEAAAVSASMLQNARQQNWDYVITLNDTYLALVDQIRQLGWTAPFNAEDRAIKHNLLLNILATDAATRDLIMPQLQRLGGLISTAKRRHNVQRVYQQGQTRLP